MKAVLALVCLCVVRTLFAIEASDSFRSPRNPERKVRSDTRMIVLHTTEAPARSSINKVSDRGECHFVVTEEGRIYRIVDRDREAFHAGRSMWGGREDVDKYSVGIECVGYHNKSMPLPQLEAIRQLVKELQAMYGIPDERVVAHSHVAYGAPNRWQKSKHRGRKRCGMLFAMASVRRKLGLTRRPAFDPDVRARRLVVGDDYLNKVLYGGVDTMAAVYGGKPATPRPLAPPPVPRTPVRKPVAAVAPKAPAAIGRSNPKSIQELKARGFVQLGTISKTRTALRIAGSKWNAADTYYVIRNKIIPGNRIDSRRIENGMTIWRRK